ncbi:MAG: sulfotransferase [Halieaceae bacterium]|jgi:hypothetical protein|nr:sulfotransferase [Halieaceae bacterium]
MTEQIRIEDLTKPVLSDIQKMAMEYATQQPISFTAESLLQAAVEQTGLEDFGADDFRARLKVWMQAINEDSNLNPLGRLGVYGDCLRYAASRLRIEHTLKQHPEIYDIEIRKPIIVAGLPRSGTTHLLNLMSADSRLHSLPYWESCAPVPEAAVGTEIEQDPRYVRCSEGWEQMRTMMPLIAAMHPMPPEHIHEEIELQGPDFSSYLLEWIAHVPRWRDYYLQHDQTPHYHYMKKVLQIIQWYRGDKRWVLKSPQHMEQLKPLMNTFPDATVVITHRDPVSVIQSAATMLTYGDRVRNKRVDAGATLDYWTQRIETILRACVRDRDAVSPDQSIDVLFHEFMAQEVATVEQIYSKADLPMTDQARAELDAYIASNPRGKHGQVIYNLRKDFGAEPQQVRERFGFYMERFPVRLEVD